MICKDDDEEEFVVCLSSDDNDIFINMWTPTWQDLEQCKHIMVTSPTEWDSREVTFPSTTKVDIDDIESRNVSACCSSRRDMGCTDFGDHYQQPLKIFHIQVFNA